MGRRSGGSMEVVRMVRCHAEHPEQCGRRAGHGGPCQPQGEVLLADRVRELEAEVKRLRVERDTVASHRTRLRSRGWDVVRRLERAPTAAIAEMVGKLRAALEADRALDTATGRESGE